MESYSPTKRNATHNAKSTTMLVLNILLILKLVFRHSRQRKQEDGTLRGGNEIGVMWIME